MKINEIEDSPSYTIYEIEIDSELSTNHEVTLDKQYYEELTKGLITPEELIKKSFEFLLERESNQRILDKFNLKQINDYFPEFEKEVMK